MSSVLAKRPVRHGVACRAAEMSDEDLLNEYLTAMEPVSHEAFRELVLRHGPMVLGVCRHVLNQAQDAEDAFQTTFLLLAEQGASIRDRRALSGWLHEVAYRIALRSRANAARRHALERQGMAMGVNEYEPDDQGERAAWNELRPVLHEELSRLPAKYRLPVIMSYLEGRTNEEVAEQLHWPVGTVKGRLSRARELLKSRLMRRGLSLSAAFLLASLSRGRVFAEVVSSDLLQRTVLRAVTLVQPAAPVDSSPSRPTEPVPPIDLGMSAERSARLGLGRMRRFRLAATCMFLFFLVAIGSAVAVMGTGGRLSPMSLLGRLLEYRGFVPGRAGPDHCR